MIKLKSLLNESIFNLEDYREVLYDYMSDEFLKEFDPRQQLMFGLTINDLKKALVDKVLNTKIEFGLGSDKPHGSYDAEADTIYVYYDPKKYDRYPRYTDYIDSIIFHELVHALNFRKKLWSSVSYDTLMLGKSYYNDPEEIRAYRAEIRNYLVKFLGMSRKKAEALMNKYTSDSSSHRKDQIPKYYDMVKEMGIIKEARMDPAVILGSVSQDYEVIADPADDVHAKHPLRHYRNKHWRYIPKLQMLGWWEPPDETEDNRVKSYLSDLGYKVNMVYNYGYVGENKKIGMIKLKEILEYCPDSVGLFSETPMRIASWTPDILNKLSGNYTFTIGLKEKATHVGMFDNKYDIYSYPNSKEIIDCFVDGDYTVAYFQYFINNNFIEVNRVWQDSLHIGLNRKIIFNYYLTKYNGFITDNVHTELGEKSIKKLLRQAKEDGYKIFALKKDKERIEINNLDDLDKYYSDGPIGLQYRLGIEKI